MKCYIQRGLWICSGMSRLYPPSVTHMGLLSLRLDTMIKEFYLPLEESIFWTDSTIVLRYIHNKEKPFHLCGKQSSHHPELVNSHQWCHVESGLNPADVITRGQMVDELLTNQKWLIGLKLLHQDGHMWLSLPVLTTLNIKIQK